MIDIKSALSAGKQAQSQAQSLAAKLGKFPAGKSLLAGPAKAATWRDRLVTASFRGIEFLTDSHDAKGGKRLVVKQFPGSDIPEVEDLGADAWDWRLTAYFIGTDYDLARNKLVAKLAEPGAVWLTHPWLGLLWVRAHKWALHDSNDKGGYGTVVIDFVEGGGWAQPRTDRVDTAVDKIDLFSAAALDGFSLESMTAGGMTSFLATVSGKLDVLRSAISLAALPLTLVSQIRTTIAGLKGDLATLMAIPSAYATALQGLANDIGLGIGNNEVPDTDRPRLINGLVRSVSISGTAGVTTGSSSGSGGSVDAVTTDPVVRRNLVREDALRSQLMVAAVAQIALADYRAAPDRDAALAGAVGAIEELLHNLPDVVFQAAVAARVALIDALQAQDLAPAIERDIVGPLPAAVLAYRMGVDEDVFLARNQVRHPLFVTGHVYG